MSLTLKNVRILKQGSALFDPVTLTIKPGEIATVMGASGCGKSTLLSAVSGNLEPVFTLKGSIQLYGKNIIPLPMEERKIGILFQDDLLFPHLDIGSNLSFAIKEKISRQKRRQIIKKALETAGLEGFGNRDPYTLSGGQRARISLDFIFYSGVVAGFALSNPQDNAIPAVLLLLGFVGTGTSFLAFAVMAQKFNLNSITYPHKSIYYIGGLTEGTETLLFFVLICIFPSSFSMFAVFFALLCMVTTLTRIYSGYTTLKGMIKIKER